MVRSYNKIVKHISPNLGGMVLLKVILATTVSMYGKLAVKWEGPYVVSIICRPGTYYLKITEGTKLMRPWNIEHLKKYYMFYDACKNYVFENIPASHTSPHSYRVKSESNRRHYGSEKALFGTSEASQQALDASANQNQTCGNQSLSWDKLVTSCI